MIFTHLKKASRPSSAIAMALILATTGAMGVTALEQPVSAKKKKKKDEAPKPEYSKEFLAAYQPIQEIQTSEAPDFNAARPLLPALVATIQSADEKNAGGGVVYNIGNRLDDDDLRLQGIRLMLDSGLVDSSLGGQLSVAGYQIENGRENLDAARDILENAIAKGYSYTATMSDGNQRVLGPSQMQQMIGEMYFNQDRYAEGIAYISGAIDGLKAAGQPVPETLIRSALGPAYENNMAEESSRFIALLAENYPSATTWGDAIIITLNANSFPNPETLDLLRLSRRVNVYNDTRVLSEYVEMLDSRRYPGEVVAAIDEGFALETVDKTDPYLIESRRDAAGRVDADRRDLPALAADARAAGATTKTVVVAGDTFLSYDQPAEAEEFYTRALGMAGVETPVVLTRLGIAQFDQGKFAEAIETFGKVEGNRAPIANLWAIYASQQQVTQPAPMVEEEPSAM